MNDRTEKIFASECPFREDFIHSLAGGKYLEWAQALDAETLYTMIWLVGELGLRSDDGEQFNAATMKSFEQLMDPRQHLALEMLGKIVGGQRVEQLGKAGAVKVIQDGLRAREARQD